MRKGNVIPNDRELIDPVKTLAGGSSGGRGGGPQKSLSEAIKEVRKRLKRYLVSGHRTAVLRAIVKC